MKDTTELVLSRPSRRIEQTSIRRAPGGEAGKRTRSRPRNEIPGNSKTTIEAHYQEIDRLIGEVLLLVDLLFINHEVKMSPGGFRSPPLEFPLLERSKTVMSDEEKDSGVNILHQWETLVLSN